MDNEKYAVLHLYVSDEKTKTVKCKWVDLFTPNTSEKTEVVYCDLKGNNYSIPASEVVSIVPNK